MAESDEQRKDPPSPAEGSEPAPPPEDAFADMSSIEASDEPAVPDGDAPGDPADDPSSGEPGPAEETDDQQAAQGEAAGAEEPQGGPQTQPDGGAESDQADALPEEQLAAEEAFEEGFSEDELAAQAALGEDEWDQGPAAEPEQEQSDEAEPVTLDDVFPPAPVEEDGEKPTAEEAVMLAEFAKQDAEKAQADQTAIEAEQAAPEEGVAQESGADGAEPLEQPEAPGLEADRDEGAQEAATSEETRAVWSLGGALGLSKEAMVKSAGLVYLLASLNILLVVLVVALLVGVCLWGGARAAPREARGAVAPEPKSVEPPPAAPAPGALPVSWRRAEKAYLDGDVADAIGRYEHLLSICRAQSGADFAADLCRFRIARCHLQAGNLKQAVELLEAAARSGSPIVRAAANLELGALDCSQGGYLRGRMKGYLCLAALASLERRSSLRRDCGFLIARCLTEKVLSFSTIDASVPWKQRPGQRDPFVGLDALAMRRVLEEGAGDEAALLGPQIEKAHSRPVASRWKVACHRLPLEEFLHRLADETAMDVQWMHVSPEARRRPLTLTCRSAPAQAVFEIACGAVGLIARFTGEKVLIHNPHTVPSMAEQRSLIRAEAISAWRRFYLRAPADPRSAQGHFASALLGECGGDDLSALREYRLIARRYPRDTEVAPWALLRGARLRVELQDHRGARADLKDLLDMYPDFPAIEEAHVSLGHATMRAGRLDEALDLFQKLYYFDLSTRSQARACLGAGRCLFALDRHEDACKWLGRYVNLSRNRVGQEMADAYMLIGRCLARLGNLSEAASAFRHVLSLKPSRSQRVDALLALAKTQTQRSHFGRAIATLDKVDQETLSASQHAVATLAKVRTFRAMGLPERGLGLLRRAGTSVKDPAARIEMAMEAARCHADTGDLAAAGKILAELLPRDDLGPAARQEASIDLARICLAEGKAAQTVAICQNLLTPAPPEDVRRRVLAILAQAYEQQQDHQRAAMALSGLPCRTNAPEKP